MEPTASQSLDSKAPKILFVENLPANVLIVQHFLDEFGYQCEVATNGLQAVQRIVDGEGYNVIPMDIQMPVRQECEGARRIRAFEQQNGYTPHQIIAMPRRHEG